MRKSNQKLHPDLNQIRKELERIMAKGHHSYKVYEDWIGLMFFAFQRDDPHYLEIMDRYGNQGPHGQREADYFASATAALMQYMGATHEEVLGPLFEEYASNHYRGQYFTPLCLARMMARITHGKPPENRRFTVLDPACGAGVCLVACAKEQTFEQNNRAFFVGQDIDLNCARMCALNLMFFNLDGLVVWGNTLTMEVWGAWRTIRSVAFGGQLVATDTETAREWMSTASHNSQKAARSQDKHDPATREKTRKTAAIHQLNLFEMELPQ